MKCKECRHTAKYVDASHLKDSTVRNYFCARCGTSMKSVEISLGDFSELTLAKKKLERLIIRINKLFIASGEK